MSKTDPKNTKAPAKIKADASLTAGKSASEEDVAGPAPQSPHSGELKAEDGKVIKLFSFDDPVALAFLNAIDRNVMHPLGNIDDPAWQPDWIKLIEGDVSRDLGLRPEFVRVGFHAFGLNGERYDDGNVVRVQLNAGGEVRNLTLTDPTPED